LSRGDQLYEQLQSLTPHQLRVLIVRLYLAKLFNYKQLFKAAEGKEIK